MAKKEKERRNSSIKKKKKIQVAFPGLKELGFWTLETHRGPGQQREIGSPTLWVRRNPTSFQRGNNFP